MIPRTRLPSGIYVRSSAAHVPSSSSSSNLSPLAPPFKLDRPYLPAPSCTQFITPQALQSDPPSEISQPQVREPSMMVLWILCISPILMRLRRLSLRLRRLRVIESGFARSLLVKGREFGQSFLIGVPTAAMTLLTSGEDGSQRNCNMRTIIPSENLQGVSGTHADYSQLRRRYASGCEASITPINVPKVAESIPQNAYSEFLTSRNSDFRLPCNANQIVSETHDHVSIAVDSPCWKGMPTSYRSFVNIGEASDLSSNSMLCDSLSKLDQDIKHIQHVVCSNSFNYPKENSFSDRGKCYPIEGLNSLPIDLQNKNQKL